MSIPRWAVTQREIEACIARGPKTVKEISTETGYSLTTVTNCLSRAKTTVERGYPRRYALVASAFTDFVAGVVEPPEVVVQHLVQPVEIPMEEFGPRWQEARKKLGAEIAAIDLTDLDLKTATKHFEIEAASLLGAVLTLRAVKDGPDWREQIGLTP